MAIGGGIVLAIVSCIADIIVVMFAPKLGVAKCPIV
jgi:hypothetical protein